MKRTRPVVHILHPGTPHTRDCACGHKTTAGCWCRPERLDGPVEMWMHRRESA